MSFVKVREKTLEEVERDTKRHAITRVPLCSEIHKMVGDDKERKRHKILGESNYFLWAKRTRAAYTQKRWWECIQIQDMLKIKTTGWNYNFKEITTQLYHMKSR